jgi:hypothetical protein
LDTSVPWLQSEANYAGEFQPEGVKGHIALQRPTSRQPSSNSFPLRHLLCEGQHQSEVTLFYATE